MHEVSLMQSTLSVALTHVQAQGGSQIHRLELHVGELSGVVPEALAFAFNVVSAGTVAQGAELRLKTVPVLCYCDRCQQVFHPASEINRWIYECPECHNISTDIRQGKDLELASLEIS
ncbi:MAG: hydrogenase maturation nickel metallochaperone HypA [Cyanobacteria bacterium J06555_13]